MKKKPLRLNIGCGILLLSGFINVDKYYSYKDLKGKKGAFKRAVVRRGAKYVQADLLYLPFKTGCADYVECIDVVEHLPMMNVGQGFSELHRVLKKKGELRLLTTDFTDLAILWIKEIATKPFDFKKYKRVADIIYGNQSAEGEFHKTPFTSEFLRALLGSLFGRYEIVLYPRGFSPLPDISRDSHLTKKEKKNLKVASDMLFVKAIK